MSFNKPFYAIKINSQSCGYQITVNGCTVEEHKSRTPLTIEYPINQWLKNGENEISVHFLNTADPVIKKNLLASEARLNCSLVVKEHGTDQSINVSSMLFNGASIPRVPNTNKIDYDQPGKIAETINQSPAPGHYTQSATDYQANETGELELSEVTFQRGPRKSIQLTQIVNLQCPFPEWAFFSAEDAEKIEPEMTNEEWEQARIDFLPHYQKLWNLINSENLDQLKQDLQLRFNEYDQAFYRTPGDSEKEFLYNIQSDLAEKDQWPLKTLEVGNTGISVSYNKKITWLSANSGVQAGVISFIHTKSDLAKKYPFYFSKINGEWVVVR